MKTSPHISLDHRLGLLIPLVALVLVITASFIAVDWMNTLYGANSIYPAFAKPTVSILCALIAIFSLRTSLGKKDYRLVLLAFICIIITDVTMSMFVYLPATTLTQIAFYIGAGLSIAAHVILVIRHACGFTFLAARKIKKKGWFYTLSLPVLIFLLVVGVILVLSKRLIEVGQFLPSLVYALTIAVSLWAAWEVVRRKLFPKPNAWLIALGVTFWFLTELVGVVHNIKIGALSEIAMNLTWIVYMPAILLLALSTWRWQDKEKNKDKDKD